jgi:hypothetical protein
MSIELMTLAWKTTLPATRKLVLLALCDNANDLSECYPSIAHLARKSGLTDRAVYKILADLEADGYVRREDRGTGKSSLYRISNLHKFAYPEQRSPLNNVQVPPEQYSGTPLNNIQVPPEPRSPITIIEPSKESSENTRARPKAAASYAKPSSVSDEVWEGFAELRKAKKAPVTAAAMAAIEREAVKARMSLQDALETCCARGWAGFKAEWVTNTGMSGPSINGSASTKKFDPIEYLRAKNGQSNSTIIDI